MENARQPLCTNNNSRPNCTKGDNSYGIIVHVKDLQEGLALKYADVVVQTLIPLSLYRFEYDNYDELEDQDVARDKYIHSDMLFVRVVVLKKLTFGPSGAKIGPVTSHKNGPILNDWIIEFSSPEYI